MKRWICALLAALLLPAAAAAADYDPKQNYLDILFRAACCGDRDAGRAAAICYNEWLDDRHSLAARLDFDELLIEKNRYGAIWLHFAVRPFSNRRKVNFLGPK